MSFRSYGIKLIALSIAAGLASYFVVALITLVARRLRRENRPSKGPGASESSGQSWMAVFRSRYVLLAFPLGFALALYLILDRELSVSVYLRFAAIYAAFWMLVLLLLVRGSPTRHKLLILGLLAIVVFSFRFVDWNSRKPFLRDLYRIKEGMTTAQVEQIMGGYMTGGGVPPDSPGIRLDGRLGEQTEPVTGTISYRHTVEGWGNSDWGVVTFENGRVVNVWFDPD